MKLFITRSTRPHFYKADQSLEELKIVNFGEHDLGQPIWRLNRGLPIEICLIILNHLFVAYLKSFNFDLAGALVAITKTFANDIYRKIYGKAVLDITIKIRRVCNTLNLLEQIHDCYLTVDRISTYTMCRVIRRTFNGKFCPWDPVHECVATSITGVISDDDPVQQYETGTLNGDNVWLTGQYMKNGIYDCKRFKHPVINLEFTNIYDYNLLTSKLLRKDFATRQFINLLKVVYGPTTGIHVMFNDSGNNNPFDLTTTGFIEF